jgi:hypothetical protein
MNLPAVDHIKVYHDVTYAMYLRNVLDAWGYHFQSLSHQIPDGGDGISRVDGGHGQRDNIRPTTEEKAEKVRMLKGAILALVDESSNGVLLS